MEKQAYYQLENMITRRALSGRETTKYGTLIGLTNEDFYNGIKKGFIIPDEIINRFTLDLYFFPEIKAKCTEPVYIRLHSTNSRQSLDPYYAKEYLEYVRVHIKALGKGFFLGLFIFGLVQYIISLF